MSNTRVRLPDGSYVNVATDDPQQAAAAARKHWAAKQPQSTWSRVSDFVGNVADNALPNMGDELAGLGGGIGSMIQGRGFSEGFHNQQRNFLDAQERYKRQNPTASKVSAVAGMGLGLALPAGKALKGASLGQKVAQGARVGAAYGGAAGAGQGDGLDLARRATNAGVGAVEGAAVGAVLPGAIRGAQGAGRWARMNLPGVDMVARGLSRVPAAIMRRPLPQAPSAANAQAHRMLGEAMDRGNIEHGPAVPQGAPSSPQAIQAEVERRRQMGVPAIVGDVTDPMREMTQWSSRGSGPGQTLVRRALNERKASEANRVRQHVQDTFPTTPDPLQFTQQATRDARDAAAPLYEQAYRQPMYRTPPIQAIEQTPAFGDALPQAYRNIRNQIDPATGVPKDPTALGFTHHPAAPGALPPQSPHFVMPDGSFVSVGNGLSTEGYDQVIRAMNDSGRAASHVNPVNGRIESTTNSVHINQRAGDLRRHLMDQNEPYRDAVQGFGDDMTHVNAFNQGQDIGKLTGHEVNSQIGALPDPAHETWTTGAGTAMADEASRYGSAYPNGDTANHVRKMLGDDVKQGAVSAAQGNTGGVRNLLDRLEYEQQGNINWRGVQGNSRTAHNQALDADLSARAALPLTSGGVKDALIGFIASRAAPRFQREVKDRIAQVVTASEPQTVQDAIAAIEAQAHRDRDFADTLHRAGIGTSALYGMNLQPVDQPQAP